MAYIVNRYNGTQLVVVEDGTIDQTTDIKLIGKNYSGYGEAQNENLLHLLEHFSGTTPPSKALSGQVWYDSATSKLKFYTGTAWKNAGGAEVSATEPAGLTEGELWWSTSNNQLYGKTQTGEFILVGPQSAGDGTTQMQSVIVKDNLNADKSIIVAIINDSPVYVISDTEFTLNSSQPSGVPDLSGFSKVKRGLTLVNSSSGLTTDDSGTYISAATDDPIFWGTTNDSLRLGGILASDYLTALNPNFNGIARFVDAGMTVGDSNDLAISVINGTEGKIANEVGQKIILGASRSGGAAAEILSVRNVSATETGLFPESDDLDNLGSSTLKCSNVYATTFNGTATVANTLVSAGVGRVASTAGTANTIAARDTSGNLTAVVFNGTATQARYADLAEKYTVSETYQVGTVMAVASPQIEEEVDVSAEVRPCKSSDLAIGVISAEPAYLMNSECEGQAVGLKGRVPVRVKGSVTKGQPVYAWNDGVATPVATRALVGIALETNTNEEEKLVECVLKT